MAQNIDVLIVEPGKEPRLATAVDDLEHLQEIVGGPIEAGCYLPQRVMLVCNGEGKSMGLPPNRPNPNNSGKGVPAKPPFGFVGEGGASERTSFPQWGKRVSEDCADVICGTFLLCSFEGERFASLNAEQQARFRAYFALPRIREDVSL